MSITGINISTSPEEEESLKKQGFEMVQGDLNKGTGGKPIHVWYKEGSENPITRIQFSFNDQMAAGLSQASYIKVKKELNDGAGGDCIYLWYYQGSTAYDIPIMALMVTTNGEQEASEHKYHWEKLECDLNRKARGDWIHLWVKRKSTTYICDITATSNFGTDTDLFKQGYIRLDEDTNRGANGSWVFLWYRQSTDLMKAIAEVAVSTTDDEYDSLEKGGYSMAHVNLNEGTDASAVYAWWKKGTSHPISSFTVLVNMEAVEPYKKEGLKVIEKDLNTSGTPMYIAYREKPKDS